MKNIQYRNIIDSLLLENKIKVKKFRSSNSGKAFLKTREVEIPDPKNPGYFVTALHEVGHILYDKKSYPLWKSEYIATKYANDFCKQFNIELPEKVINHSKFYLKSCICKGLIRGLNIDNIDDEILKYVNIEKKYWKKLLNNNYKPFAYRDTGDVKWYKK
jgi:hypothetical protein